MWPVSIIQFAQPWGLIGLGLAFWLFPIYLKKPIEQWLFRGDSPTEKGEGDSNGDSKGDSDPNYR